jgi:hypothetical protein
MAKIKLVTPVYRFMEMQTLQSLIKLIQTTKNEVNWHLSEGDSFIQRVRNSMAKEIDGYDYLLFLDDDVLSDLDFNAMDRLVESGADIIGGVYPIRGDNCHPVFITDQQFELIKQKRISELVWEIPDEVFEVKYIGTGFMLISAKCLKHMFEKYPYPFMSFIDDNGEELSEDYAFCDRARTEGFKILADGKVKLGHIGKHTYTIADYEQGKKLRQ